MLHKFVTVSNPYEYLHELEWNDKLAVGVSLGNMQNDEIMSRLNLYCFDRLNHIYEYPLKILASKRFQFMVQLNRFIEMANEAGLTVKWLKGIRFGPISEEKPLFEYAVVSIEVFIVFLIIIFSMFVFTVFVFTIEKITFNKIHSENITKLWKFVDMMINSKRYFLVEFFGERSWKFIKFRRIQ